MGHESGRKIVKILQKNKGDLEAADLGHMKKVNGYVSRHLKQRPDKSGDALEDTAWGRRSLWRRRKSKQRTVQA